MKICFMDVCKINYVQQIINADAEFKLAAKFFTSKLLIKASDSGCIIKICDGKVTEILLNPTVYDPWDFFIEGPLETWRNFLQVSPPPIYCDLYGAFSKGKLEIGGDIESIFTYFWAVTRMFDILRSLQNEKGQSVG